MTRDDPLTVSGGESVRVKGTVPPSAAALPEDEIESTTIITISGIEGLVGFSGEAHPGTGPSWGDSVNVDRYLRWGVGMYLVEGKSSGTPGWNCSGKGYVRLEGNPLSKPIGQGAAAAAVVGGVGTVLSARPRRKPSGLTAEEVKGDFGRDVENLLGIRTDPPLEAVLFLGCLISGLIFAVLGNGLGWAVAAARPGKGRLRIWVRGTPSSDSSRGSSSGLERRPCCSSTPSGRSRSTPPSSSRS